MFDREDNCEYVFIWRTSEACPIRKAQGKHVTDEKHRDGVSGSARLEFDPKILVFSGDNCRVHDPRSGYEFDLSSLKGQDFQVRNDKYIYHLSVCGGLKRNICSHSTGSDSVSSCQVEGDKQKIGGTRR